MSKVQWCHDCDTDCGELANFRFCGKCGHPKGRHFSEPKQSDFSQQPSPQPSPSRPFSPPPSHARSESRGPPSGLVRVESRADLKMNTPTSAPPPAATPPPRANDTSHSRNESRGDLKRDNSVKSVKASPREDSSVKLEKVGKTQAPKVSPLALSKYLSDSKANIGKWLETLPWERKAAEIQSLEATKSESTEIRPRSRADVSVAGAVTRTKSPPPIKIGSKKAIGVCASCGAENQAKFCSACGQPQREELKLDVDVPPPTLSPLPSESKFKSFTKMFRSGGATPSAESVQQALVARREQITLIAGQKASLQLPTMIKSIEQEDTKSAVEALLGLAKPLETVFNAARVRAYRASAPKHHSVYSETPEYPSDAALPPLTEFKVTVIADDTKAEYKIDPKDTVANLLAKVPNAKKLVLKAQGLNSFLDGSKPLLSYEFIRENLRKGKPVILMTVPRPSKPVGGSAWSEWGGPSSAPTIPKTYTPSWKVRGEFLLSNISCEGLPMGDGQLIVMFMLVYNSDVYPRSFAMSVPITRSVNPNWGSQTLVPQQFELTKIPRECKAVFCVLVANKDQRELLAATVLNMFDEQGMMLQGPKQLKLRTDFGLASQQAYSWEKDPNLIQEFCRTATGESLSTTAPVLALDMSYYGGPVRFEAISETKSADKGFKKPEKNNFLDATASLMKQLDVDPLYQMTAKDKQLLWGVRSSLVEKPCMLPFVAQSCDWTDPEQRREMQSLASKWALGEVETLLQLLDVKVSDILMRDGAVQGLARQPAHVLQPYLLQLTQCLKFETYHRSSLSAFLVKTALENPLVFGHHLYWTMRSEMQMHPAFAERFSLVLAEILSYGGPLVRELRIQTAAMEQLQRVAELIVSRKEAGKMTKEEINIEYVNELVKLNCFFFARCKTWKLPLNPQVEVGNLIVEKCRYMSSKKVPLWLVFENADRAAPPVYVMFKSGDDLRQDMLTLQLLKIMDDVWLRQGLDLGLTPYRVIATGVNELQEGLGMIEVVLNADTTAGIQHEFGGGAMGAFKQTPLYDYLAKHNPGEAELAAAKETFMRSSAGYCVATYIMGIGDRHNGNIMVTKDGHLFHIDFGHFLGNFKSKFGYKRERTPFVFTPEMAYVIGGKNFQQDEQYHAFQNLCVRAFNALRTRGALLETLFACMVSAGMPELLCEEDVMYMRDQLLLTMTDEAAGAEFLKQVNASVTATSRRLDNFIHIAKHA